MLIKLRGKHTSNSLSKQATRVSSGGLETKCPPSQKKIDDFVPADCWAKYKGEKQRLFARRSYPRKAVFLVVKEKWETML